MLSILPNFLCDNESLFEYERSGESHTRIDIRQLYRRLVALERMKMPLKSDMYYTGLGNMYLSKYRSLDELIWQLPYDLASQFLIRINEQTFVKKESFNDWMETLTYFPPLYLLAASYLDVFTSSMLESPAKMQNFANKYLNTFRYSAQPIPYIQDLNHIVQKEEGLHDLHIHLNGSTETDVLWIYMLRDPYAITRDYAKAFNDKEPVRKLSEQIISDFTPQKLRKRLFDAKRLRGKIIIQLRNNHGLHASKIRNEEQVYNISIRTLWGDLSHVSTLEPLIEEILFYLLIMNEIRTYKDEQIAAWFHHYLLIKGLVHRFLVMQQMQVSFPQFQILTENTFRHRIENHYTNRFLQLSTNAGFEYLKTIEGRFSPCTTTLENHLLVNKILKGFNDAKKKNTFLDKTQLTLVAHFIKKPEIQDEKKKNIRHRFLRKNLRQRALALSSFLKNDKHSSYLVGIDAAANEMDTGPEVFAPIYRFLRKGGIKHFTYHVGEDFRHLLSGLRSIYEAVYFLDLQAGDRLGHCTALGIPPELWQNRMENECIVSQGEWLDNLVFVWFLIKESKNAQLHSFLLAVENEIMEYSHKIYSQSYPPYLLVEAWKLRKYDPFEILESDYLSPFNSINTYVENLELNKIKMKVDEGYTQLYQIMESYHLPIVASSYGDVKCCRERYDTLIKMNVNHLFTIEFLKELQILILDFLARHEIVIEVLPTSNLRISYYNKIDEYHLKKWMDTNRQDKHLVPSIVLGTDDPGIFMTNIYNEYARAYIHLEKCGYSSNERTLALLNIQRNSDIYNFNDK